MPRTQLHKITIKDVAHASNVSTQTVSRVINNRPDVSPETRDAVEKTIAKMGYQPSALARSLVQQRSYTLGVITTGLRYLGVSQTLTGITHQCDAFNYALLIKELARFGEANIVPVIESLMTRHVEGIIFAGPEWNENVKLAQSQLPPFCPPLIFLKCQPTPQYTTISIDNYGGARTAVDHLLSLGRHHIGLITGPLEWLEARQRKQGWEDGLKNVGIEVTPQHWSEGNWSSASGEAAFAELLEKYHGMNAVFASNDQMALGAFHLAHQRGLRIPEDLAFIGFDNLSEGAYFTPPLTTIEQPLEELGQLAVTTLLAQIEGSEANFPENSTVLKTRLVVRASTPSA